MTSPVGAIYSITSVPKHMTFRTRKLVHAIYTSFLLLNVKYFGRRQNKAELFQKFSSPKRQVFWNGCRTRQNSFRETRMTSLTGAVYSKGRSLDTRTKDRTLDSRTQEIPLTPSLKCNAQATALNFKEDLTLKNTIYDELTVGHKH